MGSGQVNERTSPQTVLAADIGATFTHLALIERVAGVYRLAARTDTPTQGSEQVDLRASLVRALELMQSIARRPLVDAAGVPILPRQGDSGSDLLVVTTSAGGPLRCALIGLTDDLSLAPGRAACTLTGTVLTDEIGLTADRPVRHRALAGLRASPPDIIVMVGGVDSGPSGPFTSAAAVLATLFAGLPSEERPVVVFAGNLEARRPVADALGAGFDYRVVENLHPRLADSSPHELQRELARIRAERQLPKLAGFAIVSQWTSVPITSSGSGTDVVLQFLSRQGRYGQRVLGIDVGGAATLVSLTGKRPIAVQASGWGTAQGLDRLLEREGLARIRGWLTTPSLWAAAPAMLRNRSLRPQTLPERPEESAVMLAAAREALRLPLETLDSLTGGARHGIDLIAARGGVLSRSGSDGMTLLTLLDAVQPRGVTRVALDWASVWPALGALARCEPMAALQVLERDALRDLGTVLGVEGQGVAGQPALRIRVEQQSEVAEAEVPWGTLALIPLGSGATTLEAWPARGAAVVPDQPGEPLNIDLHGGTLGLVIDARGRPVRLPDQDDARYRELQTWQSALC
jgi:hypothetical protein